MARPRFIASLPSDKQHLPLVITLIVAFAMLVSVFYVVNDVEKVDGPSMEPTLRSGDRILISKGYATPTRGDVISFRAVIDDKPDRLLKRVIGVPGDTVQILGDHATVNGSASPFDALAFIGSRSSDRMSVTVPDGYVFVLGDNRPVSLDSRYIGLVSVSDIHGEVTWIFSPVTRLRHIDVDGSGS